MPAARAESNSTALAAILEAWSQKGLWTHAWVAAGDLKQRQPVLSGCYLPDNRKIFDLASLTKALVTTPLAFDLAARREWTLDRPLSEAPLVRLDSGRFGDLSPGLLDLTPRALLRHESGLPPWRNFYVECQSKRRSLIDALKSILAEPRLGKPAYSDVGFIALGVVLERLYKSDITSVFYKLCKDPNWFSPTCQQALEALRFGPDLTPEERQNDAIQTGYCPVRQRNLVGEVYDENAWALGGRCPHAGLFGTGDALVSYLVGLAASPSGSALLKAQAAEIGVGENESLLGWRQGSDPVARVFGGGKSIGHLGFTGTGFWVTGSAHPEKPDRYAIILTNRTVSGRVNPAIKDFRRECLTLLWQGV